MSKILAIDYGTRKTGFAISDELQMFSERLDTFFYKKQDELVEKIVEIIENNSVKLILVGLPIDFDEEISLSDETTAQSDDQSKQTETSKKVEQFIANLQKEFLDKEMDVEIKTINEIFTSRIARDNAKEMRYKSGDIDSEAARIMLQEFLDSQTNN